MTWLIQNKVCILGLLLFLPGFLTVICHNHQYLTNQCNKVIAHFSNSQSGSRSLSVLMFQSTPSLFVIVNVGIIDCDNVFLFCGCVAGWKSCVVDSASKTLYSMTTMSSLVMLAEALSSLLE